MSVTLSGIGAAYTSDNELLTSQTERENDVTVQYFVDLSATGYHLLIDLDGAAWPHKLQGQNGSRIDITSGIYGATLEINADGIVQVGVITKIDAAKATIEYPVNIPFYTGAIKVTLIDVLRLVPSQLKCDFDENGVLQHIITNTKEVDTVSVNTGTTLPSPNGLTAPGLGDIIMKYTAVASSIGFGAFIMYHNTE